ncbi:MAG: hypothetical protein WAX77_14200 [Methylococcaceae bacterium]
MKNIARLLVINIMLASFLLMGAKPVNKKPLVNNSVEITEPQPPLDLSLPVQLPNIVDEPINLEPEKNIEKPNAFSPKEKQRAIELKGKLIMSPDTEKRRSTVDGAGVTMDMKL